MSYDQDGRVRTPGVQDSRGTASNSISVDTMLNGRSAKDLERKTRLHEYRIAARREKRFRKSDEKKQRKLNATILRRMVCEI